MMNSPFKAIINDVMARRKRAVEEVCLIVEADAKLLAPVDTGTLKRSITHRVESDDKKTVGSVGSNIEYAYWAERHSPYLEPAVDQNNQIIINKIKEVMTP
ncbi:MAG: HK97 gp10 family phage protein [Syntrophomonadaceae bacterium]|nr:HK97 gp10 family phage protein [Syntrophomonadaceae bacterium]